MTKDLHVVCRSLKEYNAYRNFLESEFMKLYKAKEDAVNEKERRVRKFTYHAACMYVHTTIGFEPVLVQLNASIITKVLTVYCQSTPCLSNCIYKCH